MYEYKDKDLYSLSLGQKQRIIIAEALAKKCEYIIFDEPTTMIDTLGKEKIRKVIQELRNKNYGIVLITNIADEILMADRVVLIEKR